MASDWNDALIARLRALWDEGLSTAEIGRRLGFTKNAIVGKAHRLQLPARPSPIRRDVVGRQPKPRLAPRAAPVTLKPLAIVPHVTNGRVKHTLPAQDIPAAPATVFKPRAATACSFSIGEPRTTGFRFCDDVAEPGRPYCPVHVALCFVRRPHREARDAA